MKLYPHQERALQLAEGFDNVAIYHDMGLGKTFTGSELMIRYGKRVNLVICQKSKINDWLHHLKTNYPEYLVLDITDKSELQMYIMESINRDVHKVIGVINYDLVFRRPELKMLSDFTLMLDESSLIQNERAKRTKFIMSLKPAHVILLSGSPTGGKYERLYSQLKLLGMSINKTTFYNTYINYHFEEFTPRVKTMIIDGYKNVNRLKRKMREYGCQFLKTDEVIDLPSQTFIEIKSDPSKELKKFVKTSVVEIEGTRLEGDNTFNKLLYQRLLCGAYSNDKLQAYRDLLDSTDDRLIVFYNFNAELEKLLSVTDRPVSIINGSKRDLFSYDNYSNSVTFIQYQAGAMGLNLQKANKIIYYTPPLSSELYEQSKKRTHRIGQELSCYYYNLVINRSVEEKIYKVLAQRMDYTDRLFEEGV